MVKTLREQAPADVREATTDPASKAWPEAGRDRDSAKSHSQFVGSIPEDYDTHLGPLLFQFAAADLAARVAERMPPRGKLLEIACGTGISTEQLWRALPTETEIVATDLNQAMLDFAVAKRGALPKVTYQQADAQDLPFADGAFDAVVCQFGIMFFPDKAKALAEMKRILKPGGLLAFNVWDSLDRNRVAKIAHETISEFFRSEPPSFLTVPFGYADRGVIQDLIRQTGFTQFSADVDAATIERPEARDPARGFVAGNPGILDIRARATASPETIIDAVANAFEAAFGPAPLKIPLQEIVFTAVKP